MPKKAHDREMGSNIDQVRTDVCKQELPVAETYTSFNHNNIQIILPRYQQYFIFFIHVIILTKNAQLISKQTCSKLYVGICFNEIFV